MLNTHFANLVKSYVPTIEQLTRCYAFTVPIENEDGTFNIDVELTDGTGNREVFSMELSDNGKINMWTNADMNSYHLKMMTDVLESMQDKITSGNFTRTDYFERNGLSANLDEEGWKAVEGLLFTKEDEDKKPRIYFDMDGTLAVFNKNATMEEVFTPGYFRNLAPISEMVDFARELIEAGYDVNILSGACFTAIQEKIEWLQEFMPFVSPEKYTFVPVDADKSEFIPDAEHSVLIDDYNKNLDEWKGLAVKCKTNINNYNAKYTSVVVGAYNNLSRLEGAIKEWEPKEKLPLIDYLTLTYSSNSDKRPMIVCNDGFKLFIGTGKGHYTEPQTERMRGIDYTSLEVMYPSSEDKILSGFAKEYLFLSDSIVNSTIPYVPIEMLVKVLESHKGICAERTFSEYDIEHFKIAERWFSGVLDAQLSPEGISAMGYLDCREISVDKMNIKTAMGYVLDSLGDDVPGFIACQASEGLQEMSLVFSGEGDFEKALKCIDNVLDFAKHEHSAATAYLCEVFEERWNMTVDMLKDRQEEREER